MPRDTSSAAPEAPVVPRDMLGAVPEAPAVPRDMSGAAPEAPSSMVRDDNSGAEDEADDGRSRVEEICHAAVLPAGFALGLLLASFHQGRIRACLWNAAGFATCCAAQWMFRKTAASKTRRLTAEILFKLSVGVVAGSGAACLESAWRICELQEAAEAAAVVAAACFTPAEHMREVQAAAEAAAAAYARHIREVPAARVCEHLKGQEECVPCGYTLKSR